MQIPFLVLSYGEFHQTRKLFSYERDGIHTLPIFTDASRAMRFAEAMSKLLKKEIKTQFCSEPTKALAMFQTIIAYCPDLMRLIIDPFPPVRDDGKLTDLSSTNWVDNFQDIDDALEQIQDWVAVESEADSESDPVSNGDPESKGA